MISNFYLIADNFIRQVDNTNQYLIVTTLILAGITGYYAIQTKRSVDAIENATKAQFRPYLKSSIFYHQGLAPFLRITNVGKGAAQNIEITFSVKEINNTKRTSELHLISPENYFEFYIPKSQNEDEIQIEFFRQNQVSIVGEWKCEDILGNSFTDSINLDVTSHIKKIDETATNVKYDY